MPIKRLIWLEKAKTSIVFEKKNMILNKICTDSEAKNVS